MLGLTNKTHMKTFLFHLWVSAAVVLVLSIHNSCSYLASAIQDPLRSGEYRWKTGLPTSSIMQSEEEETRTYFVQ